MCLEATPTYASLYKLFRHQINIFSRLKQDTEHWEKLQSHVMMTDLIVDKLVFKDVQLTATNDDQYFVFEDILYQIMLCFSRDIEINQMIQSDFVNSAKSKQYEGPPSGIVPFHGICMFGKGTSMEPCVFG